MLNVECSQSLSPPVPLLSMGHLVLGIWEFSGAWNLELGASLLPIANVRSFAFAAVRFISASRPQIKAGGVMNAGSQILVWASPRVGPELLDVRAAPTFLVIARRRINQHLQPFFHRRVAIHVYVEPFQRRLQLGNMSLGGPNFGVMRRRHELRDNRGGQNADHDHHDHDFDESKARGTSIRFSAFGFSSPLAHVGGYTFQTGSHSHINLL